jgi:hypothetical protein
VFKSGNTVNLGLTDATRKVIHTGDVIRKSDNRLEWLDIHLILLDNFLVMTKKRRDRGSERYFVSKQVFPLRRHFNVAYPGGSFGVGGG